MEEERSSAGFGLEWERSDAGFGLEHVGDITIEYKPPRRGRVMLIRIEAYEDKIYDALLQKT